MARSVNSIKSCRKLGGLRMQRRQSSRKNLMMGETQALLMATMLVQVLLGTEEKMVFEQWRMPVCCVPFPANVSSAPVI